MSAKLKISITVEGRDWRQVGDPRRLARETLQATARHLDLQDAGEVSLLFSNDNRVRELNKRFRGKDKPTNVLSFPSDAPGAQTPILGDIVLAFETVAKEASDQQKSLADHTRHLLAHGFLHLLGYEHDRAADARRMEALERAVLKDLGIADPYLLPAKEART